jgi:hypothetical protein
MSKNTEESKITFPYGSTQVRSIELAICSINWLLMSKGDRFCQSSPRGRAKVRAEI